MTDSAIGTSSLSSSSSAMSLSSISEQKYTQLRKRLDQLGYRQTLGVESLPLIEKLFNDLVHTTESLKKTKLEVNFQNQSNLEVFYWSSNRLLSLYSSITFHERLNLRRPICLQLLFSILVLI